MKLELMKLADGRDAERVRVVARYLFALEGHRAQIRSGSKSASPRPARGYKYFVGHMIVRHMCAEGLASQPRPSFGCLKLRPMTSVNSSSSTRTVGSKA